MLSDKVAVASPGRFRAMSFFVFLFLCGQPSVPAPLKAPVPKITPAELHKPSYYPDRIILNLTETPGQSLAVNWRTSTLVTTPQVQYAIARENSSFAKSTKTVFAKTTPLKTDLGEALYHSARMEGLSPGMVYAYRVGDGIHWSEWFQARTASVTREKAEPSPVRILYLGDAQNDIWAHWSRVIRQAILSGSSPDLILHAGDLINKAQNDAEWGDWHRAAGWIHASVPSLATPGNHEYPLGVPIGGKSITNLSPHWRPQFNLPENGPKGLEETCYFLDYQGVRLISLNSNEKLDEQAKWLDGVLTNNPCKWTIVTFHHPVWSGAKSRDSVKVRQAWRKILETHRVDLVLTGHDHTYARGTSPEASGNEPGSFSDHGTVYVISVSGPKMYEPARMPWMRTNLKDTQTYQLVEVGVHSIRFRAITPDGQYVDSFDIERRDDGTNRVVEKGPGAPTAGNASDSRGKEPKTGKVEGERGDTRTTRNAIEFPRDQGPSGLMAALAMISLGGILAGVSYWKK